MPCGGTTRAGNLCATHQEGQLRSAMLPLHGMPREPAAWRALCNATADGDPRAPRQALSWREHCVPDVEGAASE